MRRWLGVVLFVGLTAGAATAQMKQRYESNETTPVNPASYQVNVHVTHAFLAGTLGTLHLDVIADGKKLQLEGQRATGMLHVGNYKARAAGTLRPTNFSLQMALTGSSTWCLSRSEVLLGACEGNSYVVSSLR